MNRTIVALSTPLMKSAIHIIRLNGPKVFPILNKISDFKITKIGYSIQRVSIIKNLKIVDNVLLMKFVAPNSFTGEDMVEINCHGSLFIVKTIIELCIKNGACLAKNGEFSRIAYLNKKINLIQAGAINRIINANNQRSLDLSLHCLSKEMSNSFLLVASQLFKIIGEIEVSIDYPEYDNSSCSTSIIKDLKISVSKLTKILNDSKKVAPLIEGIKVIILGKPNVGKSSLLNALIKKNKAIVSNISGTTRDCIEQSVVINGLTYTFIDTAGLRETKNKVEKIGINRVKSCIEKADIILFVVDGSKKLDKRDGNIITLLKNKKYITVVNKSDLNTLPMEGIKISAKNLKIAPLLDKLIKEAPKAGIKSSILLPDEHSLVLLEQSISLLSLSLRSLVQKQPIDLIVEFLHDAHNLLLTISGTHQDYNFIDKLFDSFCVGK